MARVEPRTLSFEDLIDQVRQGVMRCPRFQRRFVWRGDQVLEFFDSIRLRYPVGSLLIWRTRERYSSFDRVGPIKVSPDQPPAPAEVGYILDGHQRVSALFGVFALNDSDVGELPRADRVFVVHYDLQSEQFIHVRFPEEHHLPVRYLLGREDQLTAWLDGHRDKTEPGTSERARWDTFRRRANYLQTTFAQYRLPYIDVTEAKLDEAVKVFVRVNSQGTPVRQAEVFAALTWHQGDFDFAGATRELLDQHPLYKNFGTEPVLRSLLAALGKSLYTSDWEAVLKEHRADLRGAMDAVGEAFGRALDFLGSDFGASSGKVVPYSLHIVLLTEFFRLCPEPEAPARDELLRWLWATSFASAYTSSGSFRIDDDVARARQLARGEAVSLLPQRLRLRPFPRRFHPKSARVRVFHLFLKTLEPRDLLRGNVIRREQIFLNGMADARAITPGGGRQVWRLASRLVVGSGRGSLLSIFKKFIHQPRIIDMDEPSSDRPSFITATLASHLITPEAEEALLRGDFERFLSLREKALIEAERNFAKQYVDVPETGEDEVDEEPEIDVEDDSEPDL